MLRIFAVTGTLLLGVMLLAQAQPSNPGMTPFGGITLGHCAKFGPSTRFQLQDAGACGGGGGMAIGGAVAGATTGNPAQQSVLFADSAGNLAQDNANFAWDAINTQLVIRQLNIVGTAFVQSLTVTVGNVTAASYLQGGNGTGSFDTNSLILNAPDTNYGALANIGHGRWSAGYTADQNTTLASPVFSWYDLVDGGLARFETNAAVSATGYVIDTPATGATVDMTGANPIYTEIIDPAGTLATLTIILPDAAADGQILRLKFSQVITALTISPNAGDSAKGTPATAALGGMIECMFTGTAGSGTWYC